MNSLYWFAALALSGQVETLERRSDIAYQEAVARRDLLAKHHIRSGYSSFLFLYRDDVTRARASLAELLNVERLDLAAPIRKDRWPETAYSSLDYNNLVALAHVDLYEGRALDAFKRTTKMWPWLKSSQLLRLQFIGADLRYLRARAALAVGGEEQIAKREIAALKRDSSRIARPYASLLSGVLEARNGSPKRSNDAFTSASRDFEALSMPIHAAAAAFRAEEAAFGRASDAPLARLHALGVRAPEKVVNLFVPAL